MGIAARACVWLICAFSGTAIGQDLPISAGSQRVDWHSGEAWAMRHASAASVMSGFGAPPALALGDWALSGELGSIPHLSREQQRVGLGGSKQEDLNKSPAFGRGRLWLGLGGGWVGELGWTPPLQIDGTRARDLFALAVGRRWTLSDDYALGLRVLAEQGEVRGDITCPAAVVAAPTQNNPFRCSRRSKDRFALDHYGAELSLARRGLGGEWYGSAGWLRDSLQVRVDAELTQYIERIRLYSDGEQRFLTLGHSRRWAERWTVAAELMYVPLTVLRSPTFERANDALWSLRLMLRWQD